MFNNRSGGGKSGFKVYENKFFYIINAMPGTDETLFVCNGGPEVMFHRWKVLAERSLIVNNKGQLGLVVNGKVVVKKNSGLIDAKGNSLSGLSENGGDGSKDKINFDVSCRVNWSKAGLMREGRKYLINLTTVLEPAKFRGSCKVLVDEMLVPELCFAKVM